MKDLITFLLAIMIFGPSINVTDKNGKLRFTYTGVIGEIFRYLLDYRKVRKKDQ
ncbi:hypothetical protein [Enterococcus avium]|uniref:hypothetical protein n=1 Tax=Enterococcus avium TaxID=33945 RepID=UPI0022E2D9AB|nr:hypothetical protein [Enterococcus avium]